MIAPIDKIKNSFDKASASYDEVAQIQLKTAQILVQKIAEISKAKSINDILDIGAGSGILTQQILPLFRQAKFYLNDLSENMLEQAKLKFREQDNIFYLPGDMLDLANIPYDAIVSNLALQWIEDLPAALAFLKAKSRDIFGFSILTQGSFAHWHKILSKYNLQPVLRYLPAQFICENLHKLLLKEERLIYWQQDFKLEFKDAAEVMAYFKKLGVNGHSAGAKFSVLRQIIAREKCSIILNYNVLFAILYKI